MQPSEAKLQKQLVDYEKVRQKYPGIGENVGYAAWVTGHKKNEKLPVKIVGRDTELGLFVIRFGDGKVTFAAAGVLNDIKLN